MGNVPGGTKICQCTAGAAGSQSIVVLCCVFLRQATWLSSHKLRIWAELLQAELLLSSARRL